MGDLTVQEGAVLSGTVLLSGVGEPDIRVEIVGVSWASQVTDNLGNFSFLAPASGPSGHTLNLVAEGGSLQDIALTPETGVVVTPPGPVPPLTINLLTALSGSNVVTGTVVQPNGVTPVQFTEVIARSNTTGDVIGRTITDVNGNYTLVIP